MDCDFVQLSKLCPTMQELRMMHTVADLSDDWCRTEWFTALETLGAYTVMTKAQQLKPFYINIAKVEQWPWTVAVNDDYTLVLVPRYMPGEFDKALNAYQLCIRLLGERLFVPAVAWMPAADAESMDVVVKRTVASLLADLSNKLAGQEEMDVLIDWIKGR